MTTTTKPARATASLASKARSALPLACVLALAAAGCATAPGVVPLPAGAPVVLECPRPAPVVLPPRPHLPIAVLPARAGAEERMAALRASLSLCLDYADEVRAAVIDAPTPPAPPIPPR